MNTTKDNKPIVILPNRNHQPSKAEISENIIVNVPGRDTQAKMESFARVVTRPAKIRYRK